MVIGPQAFGEKAHSQEEVRLQTEEFFETILPILEKKLLKSEFLCGEDYSIGDIQFYNEILTVITLLKRELSTREFPNLSNWFYKISKIPEVVTVEDKFKAIVVKYSFV